MGKIIFKIKNFDDVNDVYNIWDVLYLKLNEEQMIKLKEDIEEFLKEKSN